MNTLSRRISMFAAFPFNNIHSRNSFKNHHQKRRMKASGKKLKADDRMQQSSRYEPLSTREKKQEVHNPFDHDWSSGEEVKEDTKKSKSRPGSYLKKARKKLKRMEVEVAEKRRETSLMKEEENQMRNAIETIQTSNERIKKENELALHKNESIRLFVDYMMLIFQAEDNLGG